MHHHVSPAHIVFLTWLNTPLTNRVGVTTGLMHYWWNGQVADAGVCGWDQCPSGQRLLSSCSLSHHFFFFWIRSVLFLSAGAHTYCRFCGYPLSVSSLGHLLESRESHIKDKWKNLSCECSDTRHVYSLKQPTITAVTAGQLRDDAFSLRKSKDHTWVTLESKRENQSWEF